MGLTVKDVRINKYYRMRNGRRNEIVKVCSFDGRKITFYNIRNEEQKRTAFFGEWGKWEIIDENMNMDVDMGMSINQLPSEFHTVLGLTHLSQLHEVLVAVKMMVPSNLIRLTNKYYPEKLANLFGIKQNVKSDNCDDHGYNYSKRLLSLSHSEWEDIKTHNYGLCLECGYKQADMDLNTEEYYCFKCGAYEVYGSIILSAMVNDLVVDTKE